MSGIGAYLNGGRWNSKGQYVAYTSGNINLAMLEILVHIDNAEAFLEDTYVYHPVRFAERHVLTVEKHHLPETWDARPEENASQAVGDDWLILAASPVLAVPSVLVPVAYGYEPFYMNYMLNPHHPDYEKAVELGESTTLDWDVRLR